MKTTPLGPDDAPRAARRAVAACCEQAGAGAECCDSAQLMTSEVVTNAMVHGTGDVTLGLNADRTRLRVEVGDDDARQPAVRDRDDAAEGGRGMAIVDTLSSDWGVDTDPGGKTVWFEVPVQP